jgi:hypothetical protein
MTLTGSFWLKVTILTEKITKHKYNSKLADKHYQKHIILYIIFKAVKLIFFKALHKKHCTTVTQLMLDGTESLLC